MKATAQAHPNIALIKYWGKRDRALNLPATSSLSLTLDRFLTRTSVTWGARRDAVRLDGCTASPAAAERVLRFLDLLDPQRPPCVVRSESNFPVAAGLASSASAFAALALAASRAAGKRLEPQQLSVLARRGSGSACRSIQGGFVRWQRGEREDGLDSHGLPVQLPLPWDLRVVVAVVESGPKPVGSTEAMLRTAETSPCYPAFVEENERLVSLAEAAVRVRDLPRLAELMERSTLMMHATMLTARPSIRYWKPASLAVLDQADALRAAGVACGWTMDAGPNVKLFCQAADAPAVASAMSEVVPQVHVLGMGGPARLADEE